MILIVACMVLLPVVAALVTIGSCCIREARWKAEAIADQLTDSHPVSRLFIPLRFFRGENFVWSIRLAGVGAIVAALVIIMSAAYVLSRPK